MAKRKKHGKQPGYVFYPMYWCFVLLGVGAIVMMMRVLWDNMEDYEASMPKYVAQEVEKIFTARDFAAMYDYDDVTFCAAEGKEEYIEYMERLTDGYEITCRETFSASSDEKVYQVKFGPNKLATYTLCKSGQESEYGNDLWALKEIRTSVLKATSYLITVPESSLVYADGQLLGADAIVESGLALTEEYRPEGYEAETWCTYSAERCFNVPVFRVVDSKGREQTFMPNEEGRLTAKINYDDSLLKEQVEARVIKTARAFSQFTSDDLSSSTMLNYVREDTNAYRYIRGFDGGWFMPHRGFSYENMRTEKYVQYDENTFSCNVSFDYIIEYRETTEIYPTAYTFFFTKQGDEWMLFDFTMAA